MKVTIVTESFLPRVNGVTNSVCRITEQLAARGHEVLVVAPAPGREHYAGQAVRTVPALTLPCYRSFALGVPTARMRATVREFDPDIVHLASPIVLGAGGLAAARELDVPAVAVFQTDVAAFVRRYGLGAISPAVWHWLRRLHARADLTLVPSTPVMDELERRGVPRLALWPRGVDQERFHPRHRSDDLRARLAPNGETLIGYVGRLAAEKRPRMLADLAGLPGTRLVVVGDGPELDRLRRLLPDAAFTGFRTGRELSELVASLDVFVHTGADETFCQAVQEALAAGVPVVAPAAGGPLDLVRPGHNGLLFAPDDATDLRAAVGALVADPLARRLMSLNAARSVRGRGWDMICDRLLAHYSGVLGGATASEAA
ncbi:glycosyltransferase family 1 protein [Actinomadura vinacea]|uniref:Glycosyltransferase family 1 protein n=1 Tax=Actinomadura vinacea TaxID=115336 RepID=A0ABN3JQX3_9ACTN